MMQPLPWTIQDILDATGGSLLCGSNAAYFSGISIDSRNISQKDLFVAIAGKNHDGHGFIRDTVQNGIRGFLVNLSAAPKLPVNEWTASGISCVAVDDTTFSLGDLASYQLKRSKSSVVAITGSNGKTTTREMTASVVEKKFSTLSTHGNFNNEIGLPLTLFKLSDSHQWAVLELGMNRPGEISRLASICTPDVGVITNIGPAHLEGVGSIEGVMNAKGELLDEIKQGGTAILNTDDPRVHQLSKKTSRNIILFGLSENASIRGRSIRNVGLGLSFSLSTPDGSIDINLNMPGDFMVSNALAAAAVGYHLGLSLDEIKDGLEKFIPVKGRMNILTTKQGIHIIDDTYNANPESMKASIKTLMSLKNGKNSFLVTGDMNELGEEADSLHKNIGSLAAKLEVTKLYASGKFAEAVAEGAETEAMNPERIFIGTKEEIIKDLMNHLKPGDWVLIKGSRAMEMEKIVQGLKG